MSDPVLSNQEAARAVAEMRQKLEQYGEKSIEFKAAQEKVETALKGYDEKNTKLTQDLATARDEQAQMKSNIQALELAIARGNSGRKGSHKETAEYKALQRYIQTGDEKEVKTLRMENSTDGGYLVQAEFSNEIIKSVTEISQVRQLARVRTVSKKQLEIATRTGLPAAQWEGEMQSNPITQATYGNETLYCHRLGAEIGVTLDLLGDASFDMENEITQDVAEAFAYAEGLAFVTGNGVKRPEGFAANKTLQDDAVTVSTAITADKLLEMTGELKTGYNPMFGFNRKTLAKIRQLKGSSNDHYIWQASLAEGAPPTIGGMPYAVIPDMDDVGTNKFPVVYADFKQGYLITDRTGMVVIRDNVTQARQAIVVFNFMRWGHGQVVKTEAFKLLKVT